MLLDLVEYQRGTNCLLCYDLLHLKPLFVRKLIEGEDSRLSSMDLAASASMCAGTISGSDNSAPRATSKQDKPSNGSKMSDSEEQGTKTSKSKTVLIR